MIFDYLCVYKCIEPECPKWILKEFNGMWQIRECGLGGIVFQTLNTINSILENKNSDDYPPSPNTKELVDKSQNDKTWSKYFNGLKDTILRSRTIDKEKLFELYEIFKMYPLAFFYKETFTEIIENTKKEPYQTNNLIQFIGYELHKYKGKLLKCEKFYVTDLPALFVLDLWEVFFNDNVSPKACAQCGDFFMAKSGKNLYCDDCNTKDAQNKRKYKQRHGNEIQRLRQRIYELLVYYGLDTKEFLNEVNYHQKRIYNKSVEYNPKYDNSIKTDDDLQKWLEKKKAELMGYNKRKKVQNGKTDEASKRHGSDNQSVGQTQETVPSDDNAGLER